ncbi:MAG: DUF1194 domain-containing protein [Gammaproteobacteria bacterium]|nr:DUF1194 domain-containing protein [Gammaproteobacteria bacterium]
MRGFRKNALKSVAAASLLGFGVSAQAIPVDLELSLVIDVSGSVSGSEYDLQMDGYAGAFRDAAVQNAILGGANGGIAVNAVFFSSSAQELIPFTLLDTVASINAFADTLDNFARPFSGGTTISAGLNVSVPSFGLETGGVANGFESTRQVIDVSGDGTSSTTGTQNARDAALAAGVDAINGIAIEGNATSTVITDFYRDNLIGGTGSFVVTAAGFDDFDTAIVTKLRAEIAPPPTPGIPEPSVMALFGAGLFGLGMMSIRRRRQRLV